MQILPPAVPPFSALLPHSTPDFAAVATPTAASHNATPLPDAPSTSQHVALTRQLAAAFAPALGLPTDAPTSDSHQVNSAIQSLISYLNLPGLKTADAVAQWVTENDRALTQAMKRAVDDTLPASKARDSLQMDLEVELKQWAKAARSQNHPPSGAQDLISRVFLGLVQHELDGMPRTELAHAPRAQGYPGVAMAHLASEIKLPGIHLENELALIPTIRANLAKNLELLHALGIQNQAETTKELRTKIDDLVKKTIEKDIEKLWKLAPQDPTSKALKDFHFAQDWKWALSDSKDPTSIHLTWDSKDPYQQGRFISVETMKQRVVEFETDMKRFVSELRLTTGVYREDALSLALVNDLKQLSQLATQHHTHTTPAVRAQLREKIEAIKAGAKALIARNGDDRAAKAINAFNFTEQKNSWIWALDRDDPKREINASTEAKNSDIYTEEQRNQYLRKYTDKIAALVSSLNPPKPTIFQKYGHVLLTNITIARAERELAAKALTDAPSDSMVLAQLHQKQADYGVFVQALSSTVRNLQRITDNIINAMR